MLAWPSMPIAGMPMPYKQSPDGKVILDSLSITNAGSEIFVTSCPYCGSVVLALFAIERLTFALVTRLSTPVTVMTFGVLQSSEVNVKLPGETVAAPGLLETI